MGGSAGWGEWTESEAAGSPPVAAAEDGSEKEADGGGGASWGTPSAGTCEAWGAGSEDSQKEISVDPATLERGRVAWKVRHSA